MLTLRLSTSYLDLTPDTSLNVSGVSPIFDRDRIERVFSYPIKVPATPHNQALLGYPTRLDASRQRRYQDATLLLDGLEYERGILVLTGISNRTIELTFQNAPLDKIEEMKRKKLQEDLNLPVTGADPYRPVLYLTAAYDGVAQDETLYLQINNNEYEQATTDASNIVDLINADFPGLAALDDIDDIDSPEYRITITLDTSVNPSISVQYYPATYVFGYKYFALTPPSDVAADAVIDDWKTHVADVNTNSTTHAFPTVYAPRFYDDRNARWSNYINYVAPNGSYPHTREDISNDQGWTHTFLPMPKLKYIVEQIFDAINLTEVLGSFFQDTDIQKLLVYNVKALDVNLTPWDYIENVEVDNNTTLPSPAAHGFPSTYNLRDHLPDTSFYEFIERLAQTFPLVVRIQRNAVYIDDVNTLLDQAALDLTEYADPEYSLEISTTGGYRLSYDRQDTPELTDNFLVDLIDEQPDLDPVELQTGFFSQYWETIRDSLDPDERVWRLPFEQGVGKSMLAQVDEDNPFKLLFLEEDEDTAGNTFPYATFWQLGRTGSILGNYSLEWDRAYGLYDQWWSRLIELLSADTIEVLVYLPVWKLIELRQNITAPIQIQHPSGAILGYIKRFQFRVRMQSAQRVAVRLELAKL